MKKKPTKKPVKKQRRMPTPAELLNDIHEAIPVTMGEALRVISHLEERLIEKECARSKEILEAIEKLRHPPMKPVNDDLRKEYDEFVRRQRESRPPPPVPHWPHINLPPVVIQPWDPRYPFKPIC